MNCFICGIITDEKQYEFIHDEFICVGCTHEYTDDEIKDKIIKHYLDRCNPVMDTSISNNLNIIIEDNNNENN